MALDLPYGRRGQVLAIGMTLAAGAAVWIGVIGPLFDLYQGRADTLRREIALSRRMAALAEELPALRQRAAGAGKATHDAAELLPGNTDALAAAALQQQIDGLAKTAGITIGSEEILPVQQSGDTRTVGVRVTVNAPFRSFVALLLSLAQSATPMIVDDLQIRGPLPSVQNPTLPVDASFSVIAYRAGGAAAK